MDILTQDVYLLQKHDVFLHDSRVLLLVNVLILLKHLSEIVDVVFEIFSLVCILSMQISVPLLILDFFFNVLLVKTNDAFLKLFEVSNVMKAFENVILKLLLEAFLLIELLSQMGNLVSETFLAHAQIINNQGKILIDSVEVLQFLSHFVGLLIQLLDLDFTGSNVTLELLYLIIKHELELLKFLCLLLQIIYSLILVTNRGLTLLYLSLLRVNLLAE